MTPQEFKDLLDKYANGECDPAEEKFIHSWYEKIGRNNADLSHADIDKSIEEKLWRKLKPRSKRKHYYMAAAAGLTGLLLTLGILIFPSRPGSFNEILSITEIITSDPTADEEEVVKSGDVSQRVILPDGSIAYLQPASQLRYSNQFQSAGLREVYLEGEAFFKVKRNAQKPFLVYSGDVVTKVLGTSFRVRAFADDQRVTVSVKTGKVSVAKNPEASLPEARPAPEVILTPNQQAVYDVVKEQVSKKLVDEPEIILAQPTLLEMEFDGTPVSKILQSLEENYGIPIIYDEKDLANCSLTTTLTDEKFYERIEVICRAINAEYSVRDATIVIQSHGCP